MLKNESARNPMKPTPLRPYFLPDSGGIIFLSNRVRMEKISHFVHQAKQAKFWMLTVPVRTVHTGHVSIRTGHVVGPYRTRGTPEDDTWKVRTGHVAASGSDTCQADLAFLVHSWTNPEVTCVTTGRVTHGTR
jgi:hypothetical protein